jgi:hypothetical protein
MEAMVTIELKEYKTLLTVKNELDEILKDNKLSIVVGEYKKDVLYHSPFMNFFEPSLEFVYHKNDKGIEGINDHFNKLVNNYKADNEKMIKDIISENEKLKKERINLDGRNLFQRIFDIGN